MKKIFIITGLIGLLFASCSDFLKEENLSSVTAEEFYVSAEGYDALVNANYANLRNIYGRDAWMFIAGTDLYVEGRDPMPEGLSKYFELGPNSSGVNLLYNNCYQAIQSANMALYYADITEQTSDLNQKVGEIKFLRALSYFLLVQSYGGVALVTDYIAEPQLEFDRNSAEEVYSFIISELESALGSVSTDDYDGRVTKRAVQHQLAKVHLTRAYESFGAASDFADAATYADAAIAGQGLSTPFEELWTPGNEGDAEVLFSVQFSAASISTNPTGLGHPQSAYYGPYLGGSEVAGNAPRRAFSTTVTDHALRLFTEDDERFYATFMIESFDRYYDYFDVPKEDHGSLKVFHYYAPQWASSEQDLADYAAAHPEATIHPWGQYIPSIARSNDYDCIATKKFDDPGSSFGYFVSTRDIILSRLGDTYLLAAEAYFKAGDAGKAAERINVVRARAKTTSISSADVSIDFILDERGRELLGEYHRWFDLKRTGKLVERASMHSYVIEESYFSGNNGELKILRPIPQEAIDLNQNKDFPQNPAYN